MLVVSLSKSSTTIIETPDIKNLLVGSPDVIENWIGKNADVATIFATLNEDVPVNKEKY